MVPPQTDRERLDDRRELLTRGRDRTAWNQVRVRINGGKTAAEKERLLPQLRRATAFCAALKRSGTAKTRWLRRFCAPAGSTGRAARGRICHTGRHNSNLAGTMTAVPLNRGALKPDCSRREAQIR